MRDIIIDTIVLALISSLSIAAGLRLLLAKRPFIVDFRCWGILCIAPLMSSWIKILVSEIVKAMPVDGMFSVYLKRLRNRRAFLQLAPEVKEFFKTAPV